MPVSLNGNGLFFYICLNGQVVKGATIVIEIKGFKVHKKTTPRPRKQKGGFIYKEVK